MHGGDADLETCICRYSQPPRAISSLLRTQRPPCSWVVHRTDTVSEKLSCSNGTHILLCCEERQAKKKGCQAVSPHAAFCRVGFTEEVNLRRVLPSDNVGEGAPLIAVRAEGALRPTFQ